MQALAAHWCLLSSKCREPAAAVQMLWHVWLQHLFLQVQKHFRVGHCRRGVPATLMVCVHGGLLTGRCRALVLCIVCMLRAADGTVSLHAVKAVHLKHVGLCQPGAAVCSD